MSTNTDPKLYCDKCGREIPINKSYASYGGWLICGICEWEEHLKPPIISPILPSTQPNLSEGEK